MLSVSSIQNYCHISLGFFFIVALCCCSWGTCMLPHLFMVPCICKTINVGRCLAPYRTELFICVRIRPILSCYEMGVLPKQRDREGQMQLKQRCESGRNGGRTQSGAPLQADNSSSILGCRIHVTIEERMGTSFVTLSELDGS